MEAYNPPIGGGPIVNLIHMLVRGLRCGMVAPSDTDEVYSVIESKLNQLHALCEAADREINENNSKRKEEK